MTRRAGIYVRISSDPNGQRLGVTRQLKECRVKAAALGWEVAAAYEDNDTSASGRKPRAGYRQMLSDLEAGSLDAVVVWDLDRLTRRPIEIEEFIDLADRRGVALASVGGDIDLATDNGRLFARIKGAVARSEVERKGTRQRSANDQRAAAGIPSAGRRAYGYTGDGLQVVPEEAGQFTWAVEQLLGGVSMRGIVRGLEAQGARTTAGNPWTTTQIRRALASPRYCGLRVHRGEVVGAGAWPALIDEGTHAAILAVLADPARHKQGPPRRHLLSGIALCGVCQGKVFGVADVRKGVPLYRCTTRRHINPQAYAIEKFVVDVMVSRLQREDAVELVTEPADGAAVAALRDRANTLRERLDGSAEAFAAGDIDRRQLTAASFKLRADLEQVTTELADHARTPVLAGLVGATDVRGVWDGLDTDRQRAAIGTLATVRIYPPGRGSRYFKPETVEIIWR